MMADDFETSGDPPPSEAEPQDGGLMPLGEKKCGDKNACDECGESGNEDDDRFEASSDEASSGEQQDTLLMNWLLAMTPEQRLRSHDGALEWFPGRAQRADQTLWRDGYNCSTDEYCD